MFNMKIKNIDFDNFVFVQSLVSLRVLNYCQTKVIVYNYSILAYMYHSKCLL